MAVTKILNFVLKAPLVRYGRDCDIRNSEIAERYQASESAQSLADHYGVGKATIYLLSRLAKKSLDIQTSDNAVKRT